MKFFNAEQGTALRNLFRALVVVATAFGLELSGKQVGAIQIAAEAVLGVVVAVKTRARG